jgi:hypothetical protein
MVLLNKQNQQVHKTQNKDFNGKQPILQGLKIGVMSMQICNSFDM